jgi:cysteinyl-tRNA synthetase
MSGGGGPRSIGPGIIHSASLDPGAGHDYRRDDDGSAQVDLPKVNQMLAERMNAKIARDFTTADRIREEVGPQTAARAGG